MLKETNLQDAGKPKAETLPGSKCGTKTHVCDGATDGLQTPEDGMMVRGHLSSCIVNDFK